MKLQSPRIMMLVLIGILFLTSYVHAETVILKSGQAIKGKITEKTDKYVKIDFDGVSLGYYFDEIESIDGVKQIPTSSEETSMFPESNSPQEPEIANLNSVEEYYNKEHGIKIQHPRDWEVFNARLTKALNVSEKNLGLAAEELSKFSSEYPESEFASDAQVVPIILSAMGASMQGKNDRASSFINKMELIANKYPEGRLSDFTCKKMIDVFGPKSSGAIFIPYKHIPAFLRGSVGIKSLDLKAVIDNFLLLKDNLDFNKDASGMLAYEVYAPLLIAYTSLGKLEELNATAKEATERFPDNTNLKETIKRLLAKSKSIK